MHKAFWGKHSALEAIKQVQMNRWVLLCMLAKVKNGKKQHSNVRNQFVHSTVFTECQYVLGTAVMEQKGLSTSTGRAKL